MYLPRSLISLLYTHLVRSHHPLSPPVLILASLEPDAICACRILTALLKRDYIPHKIQPVSGYADLTKAGEELVRPMKTTEGGSGGVVICMGVGGLVDLSTLLGLESEEDTQSMGGIEVWVLDARRPWNLSNVFGGLAEAFPLQETDANAARRTAEVDKGCIQRGYKPGKGGIIVFDDGDISDDLEAERNAYCALAEMPELDDTDSEEDDDDDTDEDGTTSKRENLGPIVRMKIRTLTTTKDQDNDEEPSSSPSRPQSPKHATAKQLRRKLIAMRRSHESVLEQYYTLGTSYSEPISSLAYSLASELGREDNDLLWLAIIGVTSLELSGHTSTGLGTKTTTTSLIPNDYHKSWKANRSSRTYALLRDEVRRLNPPRFDSPSISPTYCASSSPTDSSIRLSPDPRFLLLRHWSLYDSMLHSPYLASRLHVWNEPGIKRLRKLLAKMGISLTQCKQTYTHMDMDLKKSLREQLLKYAGVYGIEDVVPAGNGRASYDQEGWGFIRSWGWKAQLSAVDVGFILSAILDVGNGSHHATSASHYTGSSQLTNTEDLPDRSETLIPRFFAAYDAMAPSHPTQLLSSIPTAQHLLRSILRTGSSLLAKHQVRHLRAFRMGVVKDGPDLGLFANSPGALVKLALWVGECIEVSEQRKKGGDQATPLVLAALDEPRGTYVVVGIGGGVGGGIDLEARKEKQEAKDKKQAVKEAKRKAREEKKEAKAAERAIRELDGDDAESDTESEASSSSSSDDSDSDSDEVLRNKLSKRGYNHNRFGIAFQEVVQETNARVKIDSFDHCVVEVKKEGFGGVFGGFEFEERCWKMMGATERSRGALGK